jgi:hypothetical protein
MYHIVSTGCTSILHTHVLDLFAGCMSAVMRGGLQKLLKLSLGVVSAGQIREVLNEFLTQY